jgi:hypothetical protein
MLTWGFVGCTAGWKYAPCCPFPEHGVGYRHMCRWCVKSICLYSARPCVLGRGGIEMGTRQWAPYGGPPEGGWCASLILASWYLAVSGMRDMGTGIEVACCLASCPADRSTAIIVAIQCSRHPSSTQVCQHAVPLSGGRWLRLGVPI